MSRFGDARWQRVAVWSGAALAWGSTLTAAVLEPARDIPSAPSPQVEESTPRAPLPVQPRSGLLVVRFQPRAAEVAQPAAPAPAPVAQAVAPQPTSSGS